MKNTLKCMTFGLLLMVVAVSVGCTTQAPVEEQTSEVPQATDPFIGTWNFNAEQSNPDLGTKSATRTIEDRGEGFLLETWERIDTQGNRVFSQTAYKRDGKDYPSASPGAEVPQSISVKSIDAYTEESISKADGMVTSTATRTISKDGNTMTINGQGTNAQGEQYSIFAVYERQ